MRILRALPIAIGMTVAALATPASADSGYTFEGRSEYRDSISVNSYRRSNLGAMDARPSQRAERQEGRRSRTARVRDDESRETRRTSRRSARVASLGNDTGASSSGGGHHGVASFYWQPQRVASGGWF